MSWTSPRTWVALELVTASILNTHVRDNLNHLRDALLGVQDLGANWLVGFGRSLLLTDPDVAHGITTLYATDVWGGVEQLSATAGGATFFGVSDSDAAALKLLAIIGSASPTIVPLDIIIQKKNGTGVQSLASGEVLMRVRNNATTAALFYGNGGLTTVGGLNVGLIAAPTANTLCVGDANFSMLYTSATSVGLGFDANDFLAYDRTGGVWTFQQGGTNMFSVGPTHVNVRDGLSIGSNPVSLRSGALTLKEIATPSAASANEAIVYCDDNGSGKSRIMALFSSGAAQVMALQP